MKIMTDAEGKYKIPNGFFKEVFFLIYQIFYLFFDKKTFFTNFRTLQSFFLYIFSQHLLAKPNTSLTTA